MHGTADFVIPFSLGQSTYRDYIQRVQGCPSSNPELIYSIPSYYNMECYERKPCGSTNTSSVWCQYTNMGHIYPANGLLRAWNYFEFDNLGGGTRPPTPAPAPTPEPELRCDQCTSNGFAADECGCGVCGSFGGCSFSCDVDESAGRPACTPISCDQCASLGYGADECSCGVCGSFGDCSWSCDASNSFSGPTCAS